MKLYFAPLEGICTPTFRLSHASLFEGCDGYYAPFITPSENEKITNKTLRTVLPENNPGIKLTVQVLANNSNAFLNFADKVRKIGYDEININMGCPSATVVGKGRGSGFLKYPEKIDKFLYEIFSGTDMKISVKTRIGFYSAEEFEPLMRVYNKYPLSLLIVHPRTRQQFYGGKPDMTAFETAYEMSENRLCYNGDICTAEYFEYIKERFPNIDSVMIGRGAVKNPAVFREIKGGAPLCCEDILRFTVALIENYYAIYKCDIFTVQKLKEIWMYVMQNCPDEKKLLKTIKKCEKIADFEAAAQRLPEITLHRTLI